MKKKKIEKTEKKPVLPMNEEIKSNSKKDRKRKMLANGLIVAFLLFLAVLAKVYIFKGNIRINEKPNKAPSEKIENSPTVETTTTIATTTTVPGAAPVTTTTTPQSFTTYTVKDGDTYSSIANTNGMTSAKLMEYNGTTDPNSLQVGQQIKIPK